VGGMLLLVLPLSYLFLKLSYPPQTVFYLSIISSVIAMALRILLLNRMVALNIVDYVSQVLLPLLLVTIVAYTTPLLLLQQLSDGFLRFLLLSSVGLISSIVSVWIFAFTKTERKFVFDFISRKIKGTKEMSLSQSKSV